jgi:hypothetical protein
MCLISRFVFSRSIPSYFRWLSIFSWFKYANEGLQINQWSDIDYIECNRVNTTCPRSGHAVLESNSFVEVNAREHVHIYMQIRIQIEHVTNLTTTHRFRGSLRNLRSIRSEVDPDQVNRGKGEFKFN